MLLLSFFSYANSRYSVELRIVDENNTLIHSSQIIGDLIPRDYKPQDMVDMGDGRLVISWNMTPDHPSLPNLGAAAQVYDYAGSSLDYVLDCRERYRINEFRMEYQYL